MPTLRKNRLQPVLAGFDDPADPPPAASPVEPTPAAAKPAPICRSADGTIDLTGKTVYVVDSHSLIYQVFHAMPEMTGPNGQPVGAVQGFVRDVLDLIETRGADLLICAFDEGEVTFRNEIYDQYKAHRDPMPLDLKLQMPVIRQFLDALGIFALSIPGFEADDILATIARQIDAAGGRCLLVTSDKDCRQLITDRVQLYNIRKNEIFDDVALLATWGIRPDQVVDFQAIVGDSTDNIPGVPGIGLKGAQELLTQFGTLDEVLARVGEITGSKQTKLIAGRESALKSRELARLKSDMAIEVDWQAAVPGHFNAAAVADISRECGFRQLARRIELLSAKLGLAPVSASTDTAQSEPTVEGSQPATGQESAAASNLTTSVSSEWQANYRTVATAADLEQLVTTLNQQRRICLDTETTSLHPRRAEIVGYSFAWSPGEACYIPVRAPAGEPQLDPTLVRDALKPVLENPAIEKIGQNLKYDTIVLQCAGIELRGMAFDTMVADYLLEPGERSHNMVATGTSSIRF